MVLVVEIEDRTSPKPFLGGWRDVARDIEYHDAASQTPLLNVLAERWGRRPERKRAAVQTSAQSRSKSIAAAGIERAVQAGPPFPEIAECIIFARDPEVLRQRHWAAVKIQRFYRAHRSRQLTNDGNESLRSSIKFVDVSEEDDSDLDEDRLPSMAESLDYRRSPSVSFHGQEFDILNRERTGPRDPGDLAVLRNLLDRWCIDEEARMRESCGVDGAASSRIAELNRRLEREIDVLRAIESSRSEILRKRASRARAKFLDELSKPVDLRVSEAARKKSRGRVRIETLSVQQAREFRDLYECLMLDEESGELDEFERIELLLGIKKIAFQHTCPASASLENLIDQELFLMSSRVEPARLKHLRSRVRLSFLRLARGALRHDNRIKYPEKTRLCPSCNRLRKLEAFEADHRERISRTCVDCVALKPRRREAEVCSEIYERMLKELRRSEAARPQGSKSLAFAMGSQAIRYLVNDIWHGRSAISECGELERLRLVRLDPRAPWSPWNTLLATRREARMHEALAQGDAAAVYEAELLRKLRRMNLQAKLYFESMARTADNGVCL